MLTYLMNTGTQTCFDEVCFDLHDAYLVESYKFDLSGTVNIDGNVTICWGTWDGSKVGDVWESEATFRDPYEDSRRTRLDSDPPTSALSFSKTVIVPNKDTLYYYRVKYWLGTYGAYGAELTEKTVWSKVKTVKTLPDIATVVEDVGWSSAFGNFIRVRFDNVPAGKPMFYIVWGETDEGSSPAAFLSGAEDFSVDLDDWDETVLLQSSSLLFPENGSVSRTLTGLSQNSDYYIRCVQLGSPSTEGVTGWAWSPTLVGTTSSAAGAQAAAGAAAGAATALAGGTMAQVGAAAAAAVIAAGGTPFSVAVGTAAGLAVTAAGGSAAEIAAAIYAATTTPNAIFSDRISEWFADEAAATAAYGHISNWDTSTVTNMTSAFQGRASFNEDISAWNVSNVTDMNYMFYGATAFNQNIGSWKTSAVTDMQAMFQDASSFDQDISSWVITAVTNYANLDANTSTSWTTAEKPAFDPCIRCVPVITSNSGGATTAISIAENITAVTTVVATEGPIYSKSGTDAALFTLDSSTGVLTFVSAPDFETPGDDGTDNDYEVTVTATNAAGADSQAITVTVTDVASPEIFITSNSVFATAVDSWFSNETSATTTYGHISNWDVSAVTDMKDMIRTQGGGYSTYGFNENLSGWDVSNVTTMENMFWGTSAFEGLGISGWDVSNVTNMRLMFHTTGLNQDISGWDTGKVTDMSYMFWGWDNNSPIIQDVSSVTTMQSMFSGTTSFNQDISGWNTGNVTNMAQMFMGAEAFDQDISNWNVTAVTNHPYPGPAPGELPTQFDAGATLGSWITVEKPTFSPTALTSNTGFNTAIALWFSDEALCRTTYGPPSAWDVSAVTSMNEAFSYTASGVGQTFNEDIGNWDVSNVTDMAYMFSDAAAFNADISSWNVSSVTDMNTMFYGNTAFDQDIGSWDVSNVTQIYGMFFNATSFNKDIGSWNTSAVGDMSLMFKNASSFVQDISSWNVSAVTSHVDFAANTSVSWTSGMKPTF